MRNPATPARAIRLAARGKQTPPGNRIVYGEFNERGYSVFLNDREIYCAGNHWQDSAVFVDIDSPDATPLITVRRFCERTTHELAEEHKAEFGGVTYTPPTQ